MRLDELTSGEELLRRLLLDGRLLRLQGRYLRRGGAAAHGRGEQLKHQMCRVLLRILLELRRLLEHLLLRWHELGLRLLLWLWLLLHWLLLGGGQLLRLLHGSGCRRRLHGGGVDLPRRRALRRLLDRVQRLGDLAEDVHDLHLLLALLRAVACLTELEHLLGLSGRLGHHVCVLWLI